jgi:RNA-directed DNA polymerase
MAKTTPLHELTSFGKRLVKYVKCMTTTNSGKISTSKFALKEISKGDASLTITGSPKGVNSYGDGVSIEVNDEGRQLIFDKTHSAEPGFGGNALNQIVDLEFDTVHGVYPIIYNLDVLKAAYYKLKSRSSAMTPGVDGLDLNKIKISEKYFEDLAYKLRSEKYKPQPTLRVNIPKLKGGTRPLGIPTIEDRIVQESLRTLLEAIYDKKFNIRSYGYRPRRGAHQVMKNLRT